VENSSDRPKIQTDTTIDKRPLGSSGLMVAPLAFGGNVFGWTVDEPTSFRLLDSFVDRGFNLIDTADVYSNWKSGNTGGESETVIGRWLKRTGKRDRVVLATKVGHEMSPVMRGLKKDYILREAEESLKRLQTDYIDLYQSHRDDLETSVEEPLEAYSLLIKQGKVRAIGASNFKPERLAQALRVSQQCGLPAYTCLQPLYNLYDRHEYETELEPICLEHKLGVICYFSLASGFLTGKYRSEADLAKSERGNRVKKYLTERGFWILDALEHVSKELNSTPARVALAWVLARPSITAPIASATSLEQLNDLIEATRMKLDHAHIELLNHASL
jgi:aryl-alcohol dehydrogenase-like predicted oxidoreductase